MNKKAIALIIVLGFIIVIISILASVYKIYDKYSNNNFEKSISQDLIIKKNIASILDKLSNNIKTDDDIKFLSKNYPNLIINDNLRLSIDIKPLFNRININNYNKNNSIKFFMNNLLDYYRIYNADLFLAILSDSIDIDSKEKDYHSEIKVYNPYFQDGKIYDYNHLKMILDYYFKQTNDENIYKIPWKKLFYFYKIDYNYIDCNLLNDEFLNILGIKKNSKCDIILENLDKQIIKNLKLSAFNHKKPFYFEIKIEYFFYNYKNILNLIYDIKTKKVVSFEKYPIY